MLLDVFIIIAIIYSTVITVLLLRNVIFKRTILSHENSIAEYHFSFWGAAVWTTVFMFCVYCIVVVAIRVLHDDSLRNRVAFFIFFLIISSMAVIIPGMLMTLFLINTQFVLTENHIVEYNAFRKIRRIGYDSVKYLIKGNRIEIVCPPKKIEAGISFTVTYSDEAVELLKKYSRRK